MRSADVGGPRCPLTGRTVAEELQTAVYELSTNRVHERDGVRYNDAEWRAYCDGYYHALAYAGAVIDHALTRRRLRGNGERHDTTPRAVAPRRSTTSADRGPGRRRQPPDAEHHRAPDVRDRRSRHRHRER